MIREVGIELQAALRIAGCPFPVVDGPEATANASFGKNRIVLEHDRDGGDRFGAPKGNAPNVKHRMTRAIGAKAKIYAQATGTGVKPFEHRRLAEHVLDLVLVAMGDVAGARKNNWTPTGGKFVTDEIFAGTEKPGGEVYELKFTFDRGVHVLKWDGTALHPEVTIAAETDVAEGEVAIAPPTVTVSGG